MLLVKNYVKLGQFFLQAPKKKNYLNLKNQHRQPIRDTF